MGGPEIKLTIPSKDSFQGKPTKNKLLHMSVQWDSNDHAIDPTESVHQQAIIQTKKGQSV